MKKNDKSQNQRIKNFLEDLEAVVPETIDTDIIILGSALFALKMEVLHAGEAPWDKLSDYPFDTLPYDILEKLLTIAGLTVSNSDGSVMLKDNDN